jgi:hydroxymethylpyrimidine pyrophosphatase-like HAD family hydrolase
MNPEPIAVSTAIRLVIADVDGSLVTNDKVLTAQAINAVAQLRTAGVLFAITSGRPPKGMKTIIPHRPNCEHRRHAQRHAHV